MKGEAIMKQKQQSNGDIKLGKFISLILRHQPSVIGISLDENGWADVSELIAGINRSGRQIDLSILERIVAQNDKQRYCFNQDHTKIRANQGHSISVDIQLQQKKPPALLYHGTATAFLKALQKMESKNNLGNMYIFLRINRLLLTSVSAMEFQQY